MCASIHLYKVMSSYFSKFYAHLYSYQHSWVPSNTIAQIFVNMIVRVCVRCSASPTLCNPVNFSPPCSSIHGIFQARVLEWVAISFSRRSSGPRDWTQVSCTAGRFFTHWATREALMVQLINNLPAKQETLVRSLCQEDAPEKGMATHSSILVWRIPWIEEPTVHGVTNSWTQLSN